MIIEFDAVSYTYEGPAALRDAQDRDRDRHPTSKGSSHRRWGNDPNEAWALRDLTFTVRAGEFLGIAGHTGSGKSTLLLALAGLIKPLAGRVCVIEDDGRRTTPEAARRRIGLVFQYPEHQLFAPTVIEDVSFGPKNLGLNDEQARQRALSALGRVGLDAEAVADRSPFQLSGGQQRRVALAGVLAMNPAVLAMDEPAAGLDPRGRRELLELVKSLHRDGITCVMISHSMADLADLADRILVLNEGRIVTIASPEAVFDDCDRLASIGLDVPPAASLARRLREGGLPLHGGLYGERELTETLIATLAPDAPPHVSPAPERS